MSINEPPVTPLKNNSPQIFPTLSNQEHQRVLFPFRVPKQLTSFCSIKNTSPSLHMLLRSSCNPTMSSLPSSSDAYHISRFFTRRLSRVFRNLCVAPRISSPRSHITHHTHTREITMWIPKKHHLLFAKFRIEILWVGALGGQMAFATGFEVPYGYVWTNGVTCRRDAL